MLTEALEHLVRGIVDTPEAVRAARRRGRSEPAAVERLRGSQETMSGPNQPCDAAKIRQHRTTSRPIE